MLFIMSMHVFLRTNTLVETLANPLRSRTANSRGNMKVKCVLSSSCNERQAGSVYSTCSEQLQQKQTVNHSLSVLSELQPDALLW